MQVYGTEAEPPCVEVLEKHLRRLFPDEQVSSRRNEDDPPDYYLDIADTTYAVEVTSLMENVDVVGKRERALPRVGYRSHFDDLVEEVEKKAVERGVLRGTYSVIFIDRLAYGKVKRKVVRRFILDYLEETRGLEQADEASGPPNRLVDARSCEVLWIIKHSSDGTCLLCAAPPFAVWTQAEAERMVSEAIVRKVERLKSVTEPRILVLHNAAVIPGESALRKAVEKQRGLDLFEAVFVVHLGHKAWFAHTSAAFENLLRRA